MILNAIKLPPLHRTLLLFLFTLLSLNVTSSFASTQVDVLVVYTQAVEQWASENDVDCNSLQDESKFPQAAYNLEKINEYFGIVHPCSDENFARTENKIEDLIDIALEETNLAFHTSGLNDVTFNLVHAEKLVDDFNSPYKESFDGDHINNPVPLAEAIAKSIGIPNQLYQLQNRSNVKNSDGTVNHNAAILHRVHALRAMYHADVVVMLVDGDLAEPKNGGPLSSLDNQILGAYSNEFKKLSGSIGGLATGVGIDDARDGFVVLRADLAVAPHYVFTHEIAHLFGAEHYFMKEIPLLGYLDVKVSDPNKLKANGSSAIVKDNWSFRNTVDSNGQPLDVMYSSLMDGLTDAQGYAINPESRLLLEEVDQGNGTTKENYIQYKVTSSTLWKYENGAAVNCNLRDTNGELLPEVSTLMSQAPFEPVMLKVPALSSTSLTLNSYPMGNDQIGNGQAGAIEEACLIQKLELYNPYYGTKEQLTVLRLQDNNTVARNNAKVVENYVPVISSLSDQLPDLVDPGSDMVLVDFGPSYVQGYEITDRSFLRKSYNSRTCTENCDLIGNNVVNTKAGTFLDLVDITGAQAKTSVNGEDIAQRITIDRRFFSTGFLSTTLSALWSYGRDSVPVTATTDYFKAIRWFNADPIVTFRNLDPNKEYAFRIYGTHSSASVFKVAEFTLTSSDENDRSTSQMQELATHGNMSKFVEFRHIKPLDSDGDGLGTVRIKMHAANSVYLLGTVGLSAITYFEEPAHK